MKFNMNMRLMAVLLMSLSGVSLMATNTVYYFENETDETVSPVLTLRDGKQTYTQSVHLFKGSSYFTLRGCLEQVRITQVPTDLLMKGVNVKTEFKPTSKLSCQSLTTHVTKLQNGAFDVWFVYQ